MMNVNELFSFLWKDFVKETPSAERIKELFESRGEEVINDHIAFRTINDPKICKEVMAKVFMDLGYEVAGDYHFAEKHLNAIHLAHPENADLPKVFISELILEDFSTELQDTLRREVVDVITERMAFNGNLIFGGRPWLMPSYETYQSLRTESEYAGWLYIYGFRANHFTVSVNHLNGFNSIEEVNEFLKENGHTLNASGGEVKGTAEVFLKQSSTTAELVKQAFIEGVYEVPTCFYEFAERFPMENGELFQGFIADNANKIFESTDMKMHDTVKN